MVVCTYTTDDLVKMWRGVGARVDERIETLNHEL